MNRPLKKPRQLELIQRKRYRNGTLANLVDRGLGYGGAMKYRKMKRPFNSKKAAHIVLRSRLLCGARSLLKSNRKAWVESLIRAKATAHQASLYKISVNSNHLHLLMKFRTAKDQACFLRDLTGTLALKIKKTFKIAKNIKVWDARPFSRLISPRSYPSILRYIEKNRNEAAGIWAYTPRPLSALVKTLEKFGERSLKNTR